MTSLTPPTGVRFLFWLIRIIGVIVPRRLRADWRQEWEAELRCREMLLAEWDRLDWRNKLDLLRRSLGAFWDVLWLQQLRWEDEMIQDLRFGVRMLLKHKGFTAVTVLALAVGIGANTAIFTVLNTLLLRSLPVKEPNELVLLANVNRNYTFYNFPYPFYEQLRHSFPSLFAATDVSKRRMNAGGTETEFIRAQEVTGNFFSVLGVPALLGRTFSDEDDQAGNPQPVAVISHSFWQGRFGADPAVVGKMITFDDVPLTIVGVTPPGFFGFQPGEHPDLWGPVQVLRENMLKQRGRWLLHLMGRLPADMNRVQVQGELDLIFQSLMAEFITPGANTFGEAERRFFFDRKLELQSGASGYTELRRQFRRSLLLLMTTVGLVLLIACANVASLLLARATARQREFTVRSALGAGRLRLVRQLLTESLLLAALGGLLGLLLAQTGTRALLVFMRLQSDPISFNVAPDARVLLFTLASALLTGLLFGLAPALRSSRLDLASALKGGVGSVAPGRQRLNQTLIIVQVALSLVLLVGASLFLRTLAKLNATDAGFNRENVVVFNLDFTQDLSPARRVTVYKELLGRLETLPGVSAAGMSSDLLLLGESGDKDRVSAEGYADNPGEDLSCNEFNISPRFFETTGTPLLSGRDFGPQDERSAGSSSASGPRTAVINQAMARRYFGDTNPLGRRFYITNKPKRNFEIVGVVKDVRYMSLREPSLPAYYIPFFQDPAHTMEMAFALRTKSDSGALAASLRQVIREVDPTVQTRDVRSLNDVVNISLHQERVLAQLGGFFSLFALALTCLGLYGVLSFAVVQRTHEIGVRIALGAQRKDVLALVVSQGLKLALLGVALGLVTALVVLRSVASLLYGVTATDPVAFIGVSSLLLFVALLASWLPARRATRLDSMTALRHE